MTTTAPAAPAAGRGTELPDTASEVLAFAREQRAAADRAEAELLQAAVQWAIIHPAETLDDAESYTPRSHLWSGTEDPVALAGPGAPLVAEFSVAEFAAAVGLGTESGKYYLGHAIELRYRLPKTWARVLAGDLAAWKARRVADATIGHGLTEEAAAFVDAHVAPVAHRIRPAQLQRLLEEAIGRYMPEHAERRRRAAADRRHFSVDHDQISFAGTSMVHGELDLADALDLDDALRSIAGQLKDLGSEESLDVRRAAAAGELARRQLALDLTGDETDAGSDGGGHGGDRDSAGEDGEAAKGSEGSESEGVGGFEARSARTTTDTTGTPNGRGLQKRPKPVRQTVLFVHLSQAAIEGAGGAAVGRVENTRSPITADQIREWCGHPDTQLTVKPVIDLADHVHVEAYEVPDRIAEPVALRDLTCVFPLCTRPARKLRPDEHRCDCDHITPWKPDGTGGITCTCQIAPLCRSHHRLKSHSAWRYVVLEAGSYLWTSPHGYRYLRDHRGTLDLNPDEGPGHRR